jgi:20S proteasome alpha/beta subunit
MTIEKAIEELTRIKGYDEIVGLLSTEEAIDLGIEALKEVVDARSHGGRLSVGPLEGETEEE